MTGTWLRGGNLKRETEFLLIAAQNNAIRISYAEVKIGHAQKKSKCKLYDDKDKTVNHIRNCSKLAKKGIPE